MAEAKSPIICVICTRPFLDDLKADDAPRYFAQGPLLPKTDDGMTLSAKSSAGEAGMRSRSLDFGSRKAHRNDGVCGPRHSVENSLSRVVESEGESDQGRQTHRNITQWHEDKEWVRISTSPLMRRHST